MKQKRDVENCPPRKSASGLLMNKKAEDDIYYHTRTNKKEPKLWKKMLKNMATSYYSTLQMHSFQWI